MVAFQQDGDNLVATLVARIKEIAAQRDLWPGFDPRNIPLALYDGEHTYLFGHPDPPKGFRSARIDDALAHIYEGRHSAVVANTCMEIGGVMVATLILDSWLRSLNIDDQAAIAIHEAFHVYQYHRQEIWTYANETDRYRYPVTDVEVMTHRLLEIRALRRAVESESDEDRLGWATRAIQARRERFATLEPALVEYERRTEMVEGLAAYVEASAAGRSGVSQLEDAHVGDVRRTCYGVGHVLAVLLDNVAPHWKAELEQRVHPSLDEALAAFLDRVQQFPPRDFSQNEREEILKVSREEVQRQLEERVQREEAFEARSGRRLIVEVGESMPLRVVGMDPSNAHLIGREYGVIHTRFLDLRGGEGRIEMLREEGVEVEALTEGVGPNPLFDGIKRVEIVLSRGEWDVSAVDGSLKINGAGVKADLQVNHWVEEGNTIRVRV